MLDCKYADIQLQALEALADLAYLDNCKQPMIDLGFMQDAVKFLSDDKYENYLDFQRLYLSILRSLTSTLDGKNIFLSQNYASVLEKIDNHSSKYHKPQIQREIKAIMHNINL